MTIALSLKVNDGLVFAADSAATHYEPDGRNIRNTYYNASKVFNILTGMPVAAVTWGVGSLGVTSISTAFRDFRDRIIGDDHKWHIDRSSYTVEGIASKLLDFMYDELYAPEFAKEAEPPELGFILGGYSSDWSGPHDYRLEILNGKKPDINEIAGNPACGVSLGGNYEPIQRLIWGFGNDVHDTFRLVHFLSVLEHDEDIKMPRDQAQKLMNSLKDALGVELWSPGMPIPDAIELARFLVDTGINWSRFMPGAATVGGPIELGCVTKHQGFKWIQRKLYYPRDLNRVERERKMGSFRSSGSETTAEEEPE